MCRNDLVGQWSVEVGYYSSMEDEVVTFWPDGTGTVEYMRPDFSDWILFRWSRTRPTRVLLQPYRTLLEEDGKIVAGDEIPQAVEVQYGIELEPRPLLEAPVPVLYLEDAGLFATHTGFGLLTAELRDDMRCPELPPGHEAH
ncbi:hypothetical protein ACFWPK_20790 [Nocardia sp. NPDC058519]|uniref:hypothetical protein n=1 Tax=Nocardia sp. NPDC058519 TaxID=3346535 RepID=UPI003659BCA1